MKKFVTILISCSLALAASAMAQQDEGQQKKKKQEEKAHANEVKPAPKTRVAPKTHAVATPVKANTNAATNATALREQRNKERAAERQNAVTKKPEKVETKATTTNNNNNVAAQQANKANTHAAHAKKLDVKAVQAIKAQHANFHAQPKPQQVPAVTFNNNYHIENSNQWQGERYAAFRSYHPEMHDQGWYHSHYSRVELIGGGYYYWNAGYWYPAWGYEPSASYYAYNGPIYVGSRAEPPDQVIADVQATLQQQGYYHGDVDGLLGPLTRQALTDYQSDNGLYTTAAIDEPTLDSLGMGG